MLGKHLHRTVAPTDSDTRNNLHNYRTDTEPHRVWEQRDPIMVGAMRRVDSLDLAVLRGLPESGARKSRKSRIGLESSKEDKGDKSPCTSRTSMSGGESPCASLRLPYAAPSKRTLTPCLFNPLQSNQSPAHAALFAHCSALTVALSLVHVPARSSSEHLGDEVQLPALTEAEGVRRTAVGQPLTAVPTNPLLTRALSSRLYMLCSPASLVLAVSSLLQCQNCTRDPKL